MEDQLKWFIAGDRYAINYDKLVDKEGGYEQCRVTYDGIPIVLEPKIRPLESNEQADYEDFSLSVCVESNPTRYTFEVGNDCSRAGTLTIDDYSNMTLQVAKRKWKSKKALIVTKILKENGY